MIKTSLKRLMLAGAATCMMTVPSFGQAYVDITSDVGTFQPVTLGEDISLDPCGSYISFAGSTNTLNGLCDVTGGTENVGLYYLISSGSVTHSLSFGSIFDGIETTIANSIVNPSGGSNVVGSSSAGILSSAASVATGVGSLFSTAGTYVISLIATVRSGSSGNTGVFNIGNSSYRGGGDSGLLLANTGLDVNGSTIGNFDGITIGSLAVVSGGNPAAGNGLRNVGFSQTTLVVNDAISVPEPSGLLLLLSGLLFGWRTHRKKLSMQHC